MNALSGPDASRVLHRLRNMPGLARLQRRDRRALAIGGTLLITLLLYARVAKPYAAQLRATGEAAAAEQTLLARELDLLAHRSDLAARSVRADSILGGEQERLYRGASWTLAEAEVTADVQLIASLSRVVLQDLESSSIAEDEDIGTIRMEVSGQASLEAILTFLTRLEANPRLTRIAGLMIQPMRSSAVPITNDPEMANSTHGFIALVEAFALIRDPGSGVAARGTVVAYPGAGGASPDPRLPR
jgi:hypothetical protein